MGNVCGNASNHSDQALCWQQSIVVRAGTYGRSVFAESAIDQDTVIALCPAIVFPRHDLGSITLATYVFNWPDDNGDEFALLGGVGSFFNHNAQPNTRFTACRERQCMLFTTLRPVRCGEELTINYDYDQSHLSGNPQLAWYPQS